MMMKDDNNNYKSKYSPSNNKDDDINCNNFNLNGNGLNINVIPESLKGLVASQAQAEDSQAEIEGTDVDISTFGNGEKRFDSYDHKEDFVYKCINNNENEQPISTISTLPPSIDNNVYVVWRDTTPDNPEILFAASNDNGQTFNTPENLSNNTGDSIEAQISTEGNNVYVVWQDGPGIEEILFAASNDNGQTFTTPENISNNIKSSESPQISTEGNNVYVVWMEEIPSGNFDIFFAVSNDNGQTFSTPENLSNNSGDSTSPQISSSIS